MTFEAYILKEKYQKIRGLGDRLELMKQQIDWKPFIKIVEDAFDDNKEVGGRPQTRTNVRLMINGREIPINNIESEQIIEKPARKKIEKIPSANFSKDKLKKLSSLPKQEPTTNIRRLSNKVIYEMDMPKVDSIEDISIINLENNIEIKALAEDRVFFKIIPRLPITNYGLEKGKLILELNAR